MFPYIKKKLNSFLNPSKEASNAGFTLVELMVVVSIVAFFSALIIVSHRRFGDSIAINNLAYDVALSVREAQIFGTSVRGQSLSLSSFDHAYVVRFVESDPTKYQQCIDLNDNGFCNLDQGELLQGFEIGKGNFIKDLCRVDSGVEDCTITRMHVSFLRPDPDAKINVSGNTEPWYEAEAARVYLKTPSGLEKMVHITAVGQISVQ